MRLALQQILPWGMLAVLRRAIVLGVVAAVTFLLAGRGTVVPPPAFTVPRYSTATNHAAGVGGSFSLSTALDPLAAYTGKAGGYCLQGPVGYADCGDVSPGLTQRTVHIPSVQLSDSHP